MEFTAKQVAQYTGDKIEGNKDATAHIFTKIEEGTNGAISFLSNPKYTHYMYSTRSSTVLVDEDLKLDKPVQMTLIRVRNAYDSVAKLLQLYESTKP